MRPDLEPSLAEINEELECNPNDLVLRRSKKALTKILDGLRADAIKRRMRDKKRNALEQIFQGFVALPTLRGEQLFLNPTCLASPPEPLRIDSEFQNGLVRRQPSRIFALTCSLADRRKSCGRSEREPSPTLAKGPGRIEGQLRVGRIQSPLEV
jgi:hypothetical protein